METVSRLQVMFLTMVTDLMNLYLRKQLFILANMICTYLI
jgi:hypothetical protein